MKAGDQMFRAQGILKTYQEFKSQDTEQSRVIPLYDFLHYQYQRYLTLCNRCNEKPLKIGEWLRQIINPV